MPKPRQADRSTVAEKNVTFRVSPRTRALLNALVASAKEQAQAVGGTASIGSYLTALIEDAAQLAGLTREVPQKSPPRATPKKAKR